MKSSRILARAKRLSVYPLFHIITRFQAPGDATDICFSLTAAPPGGTYLLNEYLYAHFGRVQ